MRGNLYDSEFGNDFMNVIWKALTAKIKTDKLVYIRIQNLHIKGQNPVKKEPFKLEKMFTNHNSSQGTDI